MGSRVELLEEVREVMGATFILDEGDLPDDASQETCGQWTSLRHMTLLVALEERFGVTFSMEEMASLTTLPRIVAAVERHLTGARV